MEGSTGSSTGSSTGNGWFAEGTATFGDRVAGAREALGMTQSELAKRLGVRLKTVRAWEDDLAEPRANKLQMLAGVLNVAITWLLNGTGEGLDGPGEEAALDPEVRGILSEIRQVRGEMVALGDRLALLEKRLRGTLRQAQP